MINFSLKTVGLNAAIKVIKNHASKIKNKRKNLFNSIAIIGFRDIIEHFKKEEGLVGRVFFQSFGDTSKKWKRLSPVTIERRKKGKKKGRGVKILQDNRFLVNSLMPSSGTKVFKTNSILLSIGGSKRNKVKTYASIHNFGLGGMPKRDFMYLSKQGKKKVNEKVKEFISWR